MALPQNPQGVTNTDRILLEAVNAQTQNLQGQTKVLHTVSDRLMKQNKEFQSLRKDMQEMGKTLLQGQGSNLSEIKKYFEKNKSNFRERPNVGNNSNKNSDDKGFFRNMMGKLFGPSKYQQKMMDDTSQILSLTELVSSDIGFIREKYSDSARAKERELLATAIAERINGSDGGGGGGGLLKGLLGALTGFGAVLGTGIISAIGGIITGIVGLAGSVVSAIAALAGPIGAAIGAVLSGILAGIKYVLEKLAKGFGIDDIDIDRSKNRQGSPSSGGGAIPPVVVNGEKTTSPPNSQKRLPGGKLPALSGPAGPGRLLLGNSQVEDAKILWEKIKPGTTPAAASGSTGLAGVLAGMLSFGAAATSFANLTGPEEDKIIEGMIQKEKANENRKKFAETDPRRKLMQEKKDMSKNTVKPIPGMFSESGEEMFKGSDGKYYPSMTDFYLQQGKDFAEDSIKTMNDGFSKMAKSALSLVDDFLNPLADKTISLIDRAFQFPITVDGKTEMLDLAPGLGTATAKVLKEMASETADLVGAGMDKAGDVITQINNNSNQTASAPMPFSAATPKSIHEATLDLYKITYGKLR